MTSSNEYAIFLIFHSKIMRNTDAQSAGSIEYIDCISAGGTAPPKSKTKQSEGEASDNLELLEMRSPP